LERILEVLGKESIINISIKQPGSSEELLVFKYNVGFVNYFTPILFILTILLLIMGIFGNKNDLVELPWYVLYYPSFLIFVLTVMSAFLGNSN